MGSRPDFVGEYIEQIRSEHGEAQAEVAERIAEWADDRGLTHRKSPNGGWGPTDDRIGTWATPLAVFPASPRVDVQLGHLKSGNPFKIDRLQEELRMRLRTLGLSGLNPETHPWFPNVGLSALTDTEALRGFLEVMDWVLERLRGSNP